jgi:uncharacterized surface protein with fasciclin (FAS1) repeats
MKKLVITATFLSTFFTSSISFAQTTIVGGEQMFPQKNIIENALKSKDHTTLVAAVKAAGLVEALSGKGPFTVFAPTNDAFENLPAGTVETLVKPENKATLSKILTYHVVSGKLDVNELKAKIKAAKDGVATMKTLSGNNLMVMMNGDNLILKDENGAMSNITVANVMQSNGVIHVIDSVVTPK